MAEAKVQVNVRLTPELHGLLITEAFRQVKPVTAVVEQALDAYLKQPRGKGKTA